MPPASTIVLIPIDNIDNAAGLAKLRSYGWVSQNKFCGKSGKSRPILACIRFTFLAEGEEKVIYKQLRLERVKMLEFPVAGI